MMDWAILVADTVSSSLCADIEIVQSKFVYAGLIEQIGSRDEHVQRYIPAIRGSEGVHPFKT